MRINIVKCIALVSIVLSSVIAVTTSAKFGERIAKNDDKSTTGATNSSSVGMLEVFRPSNTQTIATKVQPNHNQLTISRGESKSSVDYNDNDKSDNKNNNNKNNINNDSNNNHKVQHYTNARRIGYQFSNFFNNGPTSDHHIQMTNNNSIPTVAEQANNGNQKSVAPTPQHTQHRPPTPQEIQEQLRRHFPNAPDFSSFDLAFNIPDMSSSDHINVRPLPPPPPPAPQQSYHPQGFEPFQHSQMSYDTNDGFGNDFYESSGADRDDLDSDFAFNIPNEQPRPQPNTQPIVKQDPRIDYKKELMGNENTKGTPWGTKMSYTYRDPKDPNNFMQVSEVRMTMNREMDPQEAQSQIRQFLVAARNGQYGQVQAVPVQGEHHIEHRHPNHDYEAHESRFMEPVEPREPIFPKFLN